MRQLVDLNSRVAIITWNEKYTFPNGKDLRYMELYDRKYFYNDITLSEDKELEDLEKVEGSIVANIQSIQILESECDSHTTSNMFIISGIELKRINEEIQKLNTEFKSKKISIKEGVNVSILNL